MDAFDTPRLRAQRLRMVHLEDLVALHLDEDVMRTLGGTRSAETTEAYLNINLAHWDQHGFGLWMLYAPDGRFAGRAGVRHLEVDGADEIEIAYTFQRAFWDAGNATEIGQALTGLAFGELGLADLVGVTLVDNLASRRVLEKLGFAYEKSFAQRDDSLVLYRLRAGG
jgi:RimJ/RimL family protein N-acetyltransferase